MVLALTHAVGAVVARVPYFGCDVALTRALQAWSPGTAWAVATTSRAVLGAHRPSDVVLTTLVCLAWLQLVIGSVDPGAGGRRDLDRVESRRHGIATLSGSSYRRAA